MSKDNGSSVVPVPIRKAEYPERLSLVQRIALTKAVRDLNESKAAYESDLAQYREVVKECGLPENVEGIQVKEDGTVVPPQPVS